MLLGSGDPGRGAQAEALEARTQPRAEPFDGEGWPCREDGLFHEESARGRRHAVEEAGGLAGRRGERPVHEAHGEAGVAGWQFEFDAEGGLGRQRWALVIRPAAACVQDDAGMERGAVVEGGRGALGSLGQGLNPPLLPVAVGSGAEASLQGGVVQKAIA